MTEVMTEVIKFNPHHCSLCKWYCNRYCNGKDHPDIKREYERCGVYQQLQKDCVK